MKTTLFAAALLIPAAFAQTGLDCSRARYCEMREQTTSATGRFSVEGLHNGSLTIHGSNRSDVLVRMRVESDAHSDREAKDVFSRIHPHVTPGRFSVDGPSRPDNPIDWFFGTSWSVSVEIFVPNKTDLFLSTHNGGIRVNDIDGRVQAESHNGAIRMMSVTGDVRFSSHNGGVNLNRIGGSVDGGSHNGGVDIEITGVATPSRRIAVDTHNGGVTISLPSSFSAHVVTQTHNGGLNSEFPMTVRGRIDRHNGNRDFTLGSGTSSVRISTKNGGIRLRKI